MADPASAPQGFSFGLLQLRGYLLGFAGQNRRRNVVHEFPKRTGALVEDMAPASRRLEVRVVFTGPQCAREYQDFAARISVSPRELLVHPIAGQWYAFCEGPGEDVDFARALDEIQVRVAFIETELDATVAAGDQVPDVATSAQLATASLTALDEAVAEYLGALAKAQALTAMARSQVEDALEQVGQVSSSVTLLRDTIAGAVASTTAIAGHVSSISSQFLALEAEVNSYVDAANDLFGGTDTPAGNALQAEALLATVQARGQALEDVLLASTPTPAGCADAVGATEETVAACLVLDAALKVARPPTIEYVVPELIDLVTLAQRRYSRDALARASEILGLNRIPNPAAIPSGTTLRIPAR